jgi:CBS domain-containing protein
MHIPKPLSRISEKISAGHRVNKIRVREFLRMFGAERRGQNKVQEIREALSALQLETKPDFESVWIDAFVKIVPSVTQSPMNGFADTTSGIRDEVEQEDEEESDDESSIDDVVDSVSGMSNPEKPVQPAIDIASDKVEETATTKGHDPTFRIGSLPAANAGVTTVNQDDPINTAITKMLLFDYSQLPIMQGEREVKGVISWRSIGSQGVSSRQCHSVRDCSDVAYVIDADGTLFDALPTITKHGYVLVRNPQNKKITGIVTGSDLNLHFQQLTQPFLLLREIELHIRELLNSKLTPDDLKQVEMTPPQTIPISQISSLSFGHYIRLFQRTEIWQRLELKIDQKSFVSQLDAVREIRNEVMHFSPDPIAPEQREALQNAANFMQKLFMLS